MRSTLQARGDKNFIFTSEIDIHFDGVNRKINIEAVKTHTQDYTVTDPSQLLYWQNSGLFIIHPSLIGKTFPELQKMLKYDMPSPRYYPYGTGDSNTYDYTELQLPGKPNVTFLFLDGKCYSIISTEEGDISRLLDSYAKKMYCSPSALNPYWGINPYWGRMESRDVQYLLYENPYNGVNHVQQQYTDYTVSRFAK